MKADLKGTRGVTVHPHARRHGLPIVARAAAVAPPGAGRPAAACAHSTILTTPKSKACSPLFSCMPDASIIIVQLYRTSCKGRTVSLVRSTYCQRLSCGDGRSRPRVARARLGYRCSSAAAPSRPWHAPDTGFGASPRPPCVNIGPWQVLQVRVHGACSHGAAHQHAAREQQHQVGAAAAGARAAVHQCMPLPPALSALHLHVRY